MSLQKKVGFERVPANLTPTQRVLIEEVMRRNEAARKVVVPRTGPFPRPRKSHPGKPHGPAERIRLRCVFCGMIPNSSKRFGWVHKHQTFDVQFGGRLPGGKGIINYTEVPNPDYDTIMIAQLRRLAESYGFTLVGGPTEKRRRR